MKNLIKRFWSGFINFLKENGFMHMSEEEILERIPKDALTYGQLIEAIKAMKRGESKTFSVDLRDELLYQQLEAIPMWSAVHFGTTVAATIDIQPRKGIYQISLAISGTHMEPYDFVPALDENFSEQWLINNLPVTKLTASPLLFAKVESGGLAIILNVLKNALGPEQFNASVGLSSSDPGFVLVYCTSLTDVQLITTLIEFKKLWSSAANTGPLTAEQYIRRLCEFHLRMRNTLQGFANALPKLDEIGVDMPLRCY